MTDNEIVKALECCLLSNEQQEARCEDCPLYETSLMICQELLAFHALDLINRQKAEIEEQDQAIINALHYMKVVRADAIKEFAERLYETFGGVFLVNHPCVSEVIDNLVKEMKEKN